MVHVRGKMQPHVLQITVSPAPQQPCSHSLRRSYRFSLGVMEIPAFENARRATIAKSRGFSHASIPDQPPNSNYGEISFAHPTTLDPGPVLDDSHPASRNAPLRARITRPPPPKTPGGGSRLPLKAIP